MSDNRKLLEQCLKSAEQQVNELRAALGYAPPDVSPCGTTARMIERDEERQRLHAAAAAFNNTVKAWNQEVRRARDAGFTVRYRPTHLSNGFTVGERSATGSTPGVILTELRDDK